MGGTGDPRQGSNGPLDDRMFHGDLNQHCPRLIPEQQPQWQEQDSVMPDRAGTGVLGHRVDAHGQHEDIAIAIRSAERTRQLSLVGLGCPAIRMRLAWRSAQAVHNRLLRL
jgi:hypothetical protein